YDHEGNIYFVSERDGFRNLYKYMTGTGEVLQMTELLTGISGISRYSPMISVSKKRDKVLFTHYYENDHNIYEAASTQLLNRPVDPSKVDMTGGTLTIPIRRSNYIDVVNKNLNTSDS